jgi:DNA transformation protein and related proteins
MDTESVIALFSPVLPVRCRRMFGGRGIYDGGWIFGIEVGGEIFLKTDSETAPLFEEAGSKPFTYEKNGTTHAMTYWRLPDAAMDDADELQRWTGLALTVARRSVMQPSNRARRSSR